MSTRGNGVKYSESESILKEEALQMLSPEYLRENNLKKIRTNTSSEGTKSHFLQCTHTTKPTETEPKSSCKMQRVVDFNETNNTYGKRESSVHSRSFFGGNFIATMNMQ